MARSDGCSSVIQLQRGIVGLGILVYTAITVNGGQHSGTNDAMQVDVASNVTHSSSGQGNSGQSIGMSSHTESGGGAPKSSSPSVVHTHFVLSTSGPGLLPASVLPQLHRTQTHNPIATRLRMTPPRIRDGFEKR